MILQKLILRGFKGLRAGIGLAEVCIDFSQLPGGLIAIVGSNGSGKTTILDNCHPYRLMPYKCRKAKDWTPGSFSFYDQCFGSDAMKELVFEMGGSSFKSLVLIDVPRRKQEAYLYRDDGAAGWFPLNDGKTKTYDEAVERIVGSPSLFFTSVFRSQGAKNLSDYSRGDIMGIISELLNVDHIKEQSDKARKVSDALKAVVASEQSKLVLLENDLQRAGVLSSDMADLEREVGTLQDDLRAGKDRLRDLDAEIVDLQKRQAAQTSELARLDEYRKSLALEKDALRDLEVDRDDALKRIASETAQATSKLTDEVAELESAIASCGRRAATCRDSHGENRGALLGKITRAEKIVSGADEIRAKVEDEATVSAELASARKLLEDLEGQRRGLDGTVSGLALQESKFAKDLTHAENDAGKLSGLDCRADGSGWLNPGCRFIADAVVSRDAIPTIEKDLAAVRSALAEKRDKLATCQGQAAAAKTAVTDLDARLADLARWTKLLPELEQAEANLKEWQIALADLDTGLAADLARIDDERSAAERKLRRAQADLAEVKERGTIRRREVEEQVGKKSAAIDQRIAMLNASIAVFPVFEDLGAALSDAERQASACQATVDGLESRIRSREIEIGTLRGQLSSLEAKRAEAAEIEGKIDRYNAEIAHWVLLAKACSNDGVIALELDDAAPSIASVVNDLLTSCYGPRFAVRLDTQTTKADGGMRENFDIIVYDGETDEEKSITECSGGQTNWLEDAITRGICLFNIHRSDREFGTLFADERDGMLDPEKKLEFLSIKRRALELGTHEREFFITQTQELWEQADGRIVLGKDGVTVQ